MGDTKLYSAQDIEKLKQKIATYKDTLTTLKTGNSVDDYLAMKSEANSFKTKVSKFEGVLELMNEKQSGQLEEYEQQIKSFSVQMDSLNQTMKELNQDLSLVKNKLIKDDGNDLAENMISPVDVQSSISISNHNEVREEYLIEETPSINSIRKSKLPPTYKELQGLVAKATDIHEFPSDATPKVSIDSHKEFQEDQNSSKQSFPYTGIRPNQIHNGLYRNVIKPSTIHLTNAVKIQEIPINVNENSDLPLLLTTNDPVNNETLTPDPSLLQTTSDPVNNETLTPEPSLLQTTSDPKFNETVTQDSPSLQITSNSEINETLTPDTELVQNLTTNETPNEMKRQQHKNKEALSLFSIFRKKN